MNKAQSHIRMALAAKSAASVDSEQVLHDLEARFVAVKEQQEATQKHLDQTLETNSKLREDTSSLEKTMRDMKVS